jgi:23S rRNA G2069 N7-methylase RlmK/C1962 C5-methylase RlmI
MAYDRTEIEAQAVKAIEEHKLTFFDEISLYVEPTRATLYEWGFDKLDTIKEAIAKNRIQKKKKMRNKWEDSENATLQIAAYKLIAEDEEIAKITMNKMELSGDKGGPIQTENKHVVEFHDFSNDKTKV